MIYEFRVYNVDTGKRARGHNLKLLVERMEKHTIGFYKKHSIEPVGFFREQIGHQAMFVEILGYPDMGAWQKSWTTFLSDPEWREMRDKLDAEHGPLFSSIENRFLFPLPYSPMK